MTGGATKLKPPDLSREATSLRRAVRSDLDWLSATFSIALNTAAGPAKKRGKLTAAKKAARRKK